MRLCKRHPRHHQVVERQCCAGALRLQHRGFGSRCQLCLQDTHWLHFSVLTLFTTTRPLRRFGRCPGRLLCGERVAAPPGRHCPGSAAPMSCTPSKRLLDDDATWRSLLQVWGVKTCSQDTWQFWFSCLVFLFLHVVVFWFFKVGRRAAAAPGLLRPGSAIESHV